MKIHVNITLSTLIKNQNEISWHDMKFNWIQHGIIQHEENLLLYSTLQLDCMKFCNLIPSIYYSFVNCWWLVEKRSWYALPKKIISTYQTTNATKQNKIRCDLNSNSRLICICLCEIEIHERRKPELCIKQNTGAKNEIETGASNNPEAKQIKPICVVMPHKQQ